MIRLSFFLYRITIGPALRAFGSLGQECRYHPSCSQYAEEAFQSHSFFKAAWLSLTRLLRCNPWASTSVFDPLPVEMR